MITPRVRSQTGTVVLAGRPEPGLRYKPRTLAARDSRRSDEHNAYPLIGPRRCISAGLNSAIVMNNSRWQIVRPVKSLIRLALAVMLLSGGRPLRQEIFAKIPTFLAKNHYFTGRCRRSRNMLPWVPCGQLAGTGSTARRPGAAQAMLGVSAPGPRGRSRSTIVRGVNRRGCHDHGATVLSGEKGYERWRRGTRET